MTTPPSGDELRRYARGTLSAERFDAIDRWLATLPDAEVERLLIAAGSDEKTGEFSIPAPPLRDEGFRTDQRTNRLLLGDLIGSGGMADVRSASDSSLGRIVALKVLKERQPEESLDAYLVRQDLFRREAAITATLEHPAIPPVYDVGRMHGQAAFTMHRIVGTRFDELVQAGTLRRGQLLSIVLRAAEAIGYAHARGIVHRDVTPANILVAGHGAIYVIDWGLAAKAGTCDGVLAGTPGWMAPEHTATTPADPRQDVFALGALLLFAVTCFPCPAGSTSESDPVKHRLATLPAGLRALIERCLRSDPLRRYADGSAVAEDLRRWLDEGLTLAQEIGPVGRGWIRLRRSRRARATLTIAAVGLSAFSLAWWSANRHDREQALQRLARIERETVLDRPESLAAGLAEAREVAKEHPRLMQAITLAVRLQAGWELAEERRHQEKVRTEVERLLARVRRLGPWAGTRDGWLSAFRSAGIGLQASTAVQDRRMLQASPLAPLLANALPFLWRAEREENDVDASRDTAHLLRDAGPTPGWRAFGRLLLTTAFQAHDPIFTPTADAEEVLAEADPAAVALALFAPAPRLTDYARTRLQRMPGGFWPTMAVAKADLAAGDVHAADHLALIASGAEPDSLLPHILRSYVALERHEWLELLGESERALVIEPASVEAAVLRAVALAHVDRATEARALAATLPAAHLQWHLAHPVGHPMERSVRALIDAGISIPDAPPSLGPLAPAMPPIH